MVWQSMCATLGDKHVTTTTFHPQSNGMVERLHRQLKEGRRARAAGVVWAEHLPWVLLGVRAAPKEDSAVSSAEAVFGAPLVLPGQLADPSGGGRPCVPRTDDSAEGQILRGGSEERFRPVGQR